MQDPSPGLTYLSFLKLYRYPLRHSGFIDKLCRE